MTQLDIYNQALSYIGEREITALTDTSKSANICNRWYETCARKVLRSYPWPSAIKRAELTYNDPANSDLTQYDYEYTLPSDYLKILDINNDKTAVRLIEGGYLYSDYENPTIRYIADISTVTPDTEDLPMPEDLAMAIALYLAFTINMGLTGKRERSSQAQVDYMLSLEEAKSAAGEEAEEDEDTEPWWVDIS